MTKRLLALLVVLAAVVASYFGSQLLSPFAQTISVGELQSPSRTTVKAKDLTLVCPGSAFTPAGSDNSGQAQFNRIGAATVDYSSNLPSGVVLKGRSLGGPATDTNTVSDSANQIANLTTVKSLGLTVSDQLGVAQQGSALFSAQSFELANSNNVIGAIGANCQVPSAENWFVGGVTTIGREALLILANPTDTDATVNLQLYGQSGLIDGAGLNGISVSANRTVVIPLAGFAPDQASLAVHVTSAGASVASWIQQRTVRGTVAAGADLIAPTIAASKSLVIPGLLKRGTDDATALIAANADYSDLTPSVQVFVPGTKDATVTVQVIGSNAKSLGTVLQETVQAGTTGSFQLTGLKDGDYSIFVESDQPVQAAAQLSRTKKGNTPVTDFAMLSAVRPLATAVVATAPKAASSKISIANTSSTEASVVVTNLADGSKQNLSIPHYGSAVVNAPAGGVIRVTSSVAVAATMVDDFNSQIVAIPMVDYQNQGGQLAVLVR